MSEYSFDGTDITYDIACLAGGVPQTGKASLIQSSIVMYDSTMSPDTATFTVTEIADKGIYRVSTPYADLNRGAGDGLWVWTYSLLDHTFEPSFISIQVSRKIGTVTGTPTTTSVAVTGLTDQTANHYKDAFIKVIKGNNVSEIKKITASSYAGGTTTLTVNATSAALVAGDVVEMIDR